MSKLINTAIKYWWATILILAAVVVSADLIF